MCGRLKFRANRVTELLQIPGKDQLVDPRTYKISSVVAQRHDRLPDPPHLVNFGLVIHDEFGLL